MRIAIGGAVAVLIILAACNSGGGGGGSPVNGCDEADFVDRTGSSSTRVVGFGGQHGSGAFSYEPTCITISAGQAVSFQGDFTSHPLRPGTAPAQAGASGANNPIPQVGTGTTASVTFPDTGTFGFYCNNHHGSGMFGAVKVQ